MTKVEESAAAIQRRTLIQVTDLVFRYPQSGFALRVADLSVPARGTLALIGPSGSGKTTLLNLIAGILAPSSGCVEVNDVDVGSLGEAARRDFRIRNVGLVFQEFELLEHLNVLDNILLPCRISPAIRLQAESRQRAIELARQVGMADKLRRYPRRLSQGERQRLAFCRALLLEPPLLLCDEPTGNLDPVNKEHVLELLFDYVHRKGTTLLTATHDHGLLERFDRVLDLKQFHQTGEATV